MVYTAINHEDRTITTDIHSCARCGGGHAMLKFVPLAQRARRRDALDDVPDVAATDSHENSVRRISTGGLR
jgi:hypothetical protein